MKTKLITVSFLAFANFMSAQNSFPASGNVGCGTSSPAYQLHVATTGAAQFFVERTVGQVNGLKLFFTSNPATGVSVGAGSAIFQNQASSSDMLFMTQPTQPSMVLKSGGNVGINNTSPGYKLDVKTSAFNDGINIEQTSTDACALHMLNSSSGGQHWALFSTGSNNTQGAGNFSIFEYGASDRLFINGGTGNVGINTISPGYRFHVASDDNAMANNPMTINSIFKEPTHWGGYFEYRASSKLGVNAAVTGYDLNNTSTTTDIVEGVGVYGKAERTASQQGNNQCFGVKGYATGASNVAGGVFWSDQGSGWVGRPAGGDAGTSQTACFGVWASAAGQNAVSGYFNGSAYSTGMYQSADAGLKENIKPLTNAMDKLKLLKPNNFTYKTEEYRGLNLPQGQQMGLNAQDLEKDFPELVKEIKDLSGQMAGQKTGSSGNLKSVNYTNLIPLLIAGMQEQQKQIEAQQVLISELQQEKASSSTGINETGAAPNYGMDQNIPNPFGSQTTINYSLPKSAAVATLFVYDLTGKQLASFPIEEKGTSSITINSEKLAAGIYIYSIVVDGKVLGTKRMIVAEK
jgi:hypothetical protein